MAEKLYDREERQRAALAKAGMALNPPSLSRRPPAVVRGEDADCKEGRYATRKDFGS